MRKIILSLCLLNSLSVLADTLCKTDDIQITKSNNGKVVFNTTWDGGISETVRLSKPLPMSPQKDSSYFFGYLGTAYSDLAIAPLTDSEYESITSLNLSLVADYAGLIEFKSDDEVVATFISTTSGYVSRCD